MSDIFCASGGCSAKLGAGVLSKLLSNLKNPMADPQLLLGFDTKDDGAIYQISEEIAVIQTLDFFPSMVNDPYLFGKIAATNALSDVYAMGGKVKTALNLVCFPENMDLEILSAVLAGGAEKVAEAEGSLVGGHSIHDKELKYGLSVMGTVSPKKFYRNQGAQIGDLLILTKKLGTGIVTTAQNMGEASEESYLEAITSMCTLNKYAAYLSEKYTVHSCTDVTGFGLLGHLHEMMSAEISCEIWRSKVPVLHFALTYADDFLFTAGGQRNRNFLEKFISFGNTPFAMEELLFDPQTSGGLIFAMSPKEAKNFAHALTEEGICANIIGEITKKQGKELLILE